jgi:hypothetical protein
MVEDSIGCFLARPFMSDHTGRARALFCAGLTLLFAGCSGAVVINEGKKEEQNLRFIGRAYVKVCNANGQEPKDAEDLKAFLKEFGDPNTILISPVDGQPYVILWGTPIARAERGQAEVLLAYEKTGAHGKRLVLNAALFVHIMTEEEFTKAQKSP